MHACKCACMLSSIDLLAKPLSVYNKTRTWRHRLLNVQLRRERKRKNNRRKQRQRDNKTRIVFLFQICVLCSSCLAGVIVWKKWAEEDLFPVCASSTTVREEPNIFLVACASINGKVSWFPAWNCRTIENIILMGDCSCCLSAATNP